MPTRDEILANALALSAEDRQIICERLEESLLTPEQQANGGFAAPELAQKWSAELDRRIEAYQRGEMKAQDSDSMMQELWAHLWSKELDRRIEALDLGTARAEDALIVLQRIKDRVDSANGYAIAIQPKI